MSETTLETIGRVPPTPEEQVADVLVGAMRSAYLKAADLHVSGLRDGEDEVISAIMDRLRECILDARGFIAERSRGRGVTA